MASQLTTIISFVWLPDNHLLLSGLHYVPIMLTIKIPEKGVVQVIAPMLSSKHFHELEGAANRVLHTNTNYCEVSNSLWTF